MREVDPILWALALGLTGCASLASADDWPAGAQTTGSASGGAGAAGAAGGAGGCGGACPSNGGGGATGGTADAYAQVVMEDGPIAYWRLGEPRGLIAMDETENEVSGAYIGAVELNADGLVGTADTAAKFPGNRDSHIDVGDSFLFAGRAEYTLEAWVRPQAISDNHLIFDAWNGVGDGYRVTFGATYLRFARWAGSGTEYADCNADPLNLLAASHIVATYDGEHACLYLNGTITEDECGTSVLPTSPTVTSVRLGVEVDGVLDEVAIYGGALPQGRVSAHYEAGAAAR